MYPAKFPVSSLPVDPAQRFADLFLTRSKWKNEDITPFLSDIAVDAKDVTADAEVAVAAGGEHSKQDAATPAEPEPKVLADEASAELSCAAEKQEDIVVWDSGSEA